MSARVQAFARGALGHELRTEKRAGVEHFVTGQHEATWVDEDHTLAQVWYVDVSGHRLCCVICDPDKDFLPVALFGLDAVRGPTVRELEGDFELSDPMRAALDALR